MQEITVVAENTFALRSRLPCISGKPHHIVHAVRSMIDPMRSHRLVRLTSEGKIYGYLFDR
jgi:hypothetical protein